MALYLERIVRASLGDGRSSSFHRVLVPLSSGSFGDVSLDEALRLARLHVHSPPAERAWALRVIGSRDP